MTLILTSHVLYVDLNNANHKRAALIKKNIKTRKIQKLLSYRHFVKCVKSDGSSS